MTDAELRRLCRLLWMKALIELYIDLYAICATQYFQQPNADYLGESSNA